MENYLREKQYKIYMVNGKERLAVMLKETSK